MAVQKLKTTDAFVLVDLPDAPATGTVRRAKKILQSSAGELARSATYSFAAFGLQRSGASAGINAEGDAVSDAVSAFTSELSESAAGGAIHLNPGKGMSFAELSPLSDAANRPSPAGSPFLTAIGVVASAAWALGGLDGKRVAIEGAGAAPEATAIESMINEAGGTVLSPEGVAEKPWLFWGAEVDALLCGSKPGAMNHQGSAMVKANTVVPWGPVPVTTKAFIDLNRRGIQVLPDFISAGGGLVAEYLQGASALDEPALAGVITERIPQLLDLHAAHAQGVLLGACYAAEEFLQSWASKPFGRPLAA